MRVGIVFYEPFHSGQARHVLSLVKYLDRARARVWVAHPAGDSRTAEGLAALGVPALAWPMGRWDNRGAARALLEQIRREHVELVHVHGQFAGLWARPAAKLAGAPVIYTPHTVHIRQKKLQPIYHTMERSLGGLTDMMICVCEADRRWVMGQGWIRNDRILTVHNGVDWEEWGVPPPEKAAARAALGWPADVPVVLQVGRLDAQKAPLDFVRMMRHLRAAVPTARGILAGDGPLRPDIERALRAEDRASAVELLGQRDDIPTLMAAADVVTLTSRWEGLPYTLLEAGASGRPAVATTVNGVPEIIVEGETGLLVPAGEPARMAERVQGLLNDPAGAARMGAAARRRVQEHFTAERMAERTMSIYERVLARRRPDRGGR